jgi:hypothetical protein
MSASAEPVLDVAAADVAKLNDRLAREHGIPAGVAADARALVAAIDAAPLERWEAVDPHHAVVALRAAVAAQRAIEDGARDRLRVALESIRQSLAAIAEQEPVADERSPKQIVQWLVDRTGVPQARLAELLGVSPRHFQRWVSGTEGAAPEGRDAQKVRAVARIVNQLRFVLTPAGAVDWFGWPRRDLGGRTPGELLDDPRALPELTAAAASMRSTSAA